MDKFIRCQALTKKGTQCKTGAMSLTPFCGIHQGHVYRVEKVKHCFYCSTEVEGEHEWECVGQERQVVVSFNFIFDMPRSWNAEDIEWSMNCHKDKTDMINYVRNALVDLLKNKSIDHSWSDDPDTFIYRYVGEINSTNLSRLGSATREED